MYIHRCFKQANKRRWCWGVAACWRGGCTSCRAGFKRDEEEERRHSGADPVLVTLRSLSRSWPAPCVPYHQLFLPSLFVCAVLWWRDSRWLCTETEWVVERTHSSLLNLLQSQQLTTDGPYLIWKRRASTVSAVLSSSSRMETGQLRAGITCRHLGSMPTREMLIPKVFFREITTLPKYVNQAFIGNRKTISSPRYFNVFFFLLILLLFWAQWSKTELFMACQQIRSP